MRPSTKIFLVASVAAWVALSMPISSAAQPSPAVEATSLLGEPLSRPELPSEFREKQTDLLEEARRQLAAAPDDPDAAIWVGRRTAYLGRYREAIQIYTEALAAHPRYPHLYRHRGHRYITTRALGEARVDLERAAQLTEGAEDQVEPDGLPNAFGVPTSTLQTNIWYHLGLAQYLEGDFELAAASYRRCRGLAGNPDMAVAASYWLYLSLRRAGEDGEAAAMLAEISPDLEILENHDYLRLLLAFGGHGEVDALVDGSQESVESATRAYGVGAWYLLRGEASKAREIFERIVAGSSWAAFGYIAAEAELNRLLDSSSEQGGAGR